MEIEKVQKIKQLLIDKLYYSCYRKGFFLELDNPFVSLPKLILYYNINDIIDIVPERFKEQFVLLESEFDRLDVTVIKSNNGYINSSDEFIKAENDFMNLLIELANELPENPAWNKFTLPSNKFTKISCTTIN